MRSGRFDFFGWRLFPSDGGRKARTGSIIIAGRDNNNIRNGSFLSSRQGEWVGVLVGGYCKRNHYEGSNQGSDYSIVNRSSLESELVDGDIIIIDRLFVYIVVLLSTCLLHYCV